MGEKIEVKKMCKNCKYCIVVGMRMPIEYKCTRSIQSSYSYVSPRNYCADWRTKMPDHIMLWKEKLGIK